MTLDYSLTVHLCTIIVYSSKTHWVIPEKIQAPPPLRTSYTNLRHSLDNSPPPPPWTAEISSVGGVWIFFGTTLLVSFVT